LIAFERDFINKNNMKAADFAKAADRHQILPLLE